MINYLYPYIKEFFFYSIKIIEILLFLFIFFLPKFYGRLSCVYYIFPEIKNKDDDSYKAILIIIMNTLLITSYTILFPNPLENNSYSKFYYVFLILITSLTKWQNEVLFYKIISYQNNLKLRNFSNENKNNISSNADAEKAISQHLNKTISDVNKKMYGLE